MPIPERAPSFEKSRISDQVYRKVRGWIVDGVLLPGESLKDHELATRLGVSRTPVREALCRLRDDGFVQVSAGRWTRVADIQPADIDQLFPIISCLETLALTLAFPSLVKLGVERMKRANRRIEQALLTGKFAEAAESNRTFHRTFIDLSKNPELIGIIQKVKIKIRRLGTFYFSSHNIIPSSTIGEHDALIRAVSEGQLEDGKVVLAQHWDHVARRVRDAAQDFRRLTP